MGKCDLVCKELAGAKVKQDDMFRITVSLTFLTVIIALVSQSNVYMTEMGSNANAFAFKCILKTFEKYLNLHLHLDFSNEKYLHLH